MKSSFDFKGMMSGAGDFNTRLLVMKEDIGKQCSQLKFKILGAGECSICEKCTYVDGVPCRRPDDALVSLEACGIDVIKLMKDNGLKYNNGKNTVTYIGGIMGS